MFAATEYYFNSIHKICLQRVGWAEGCISSSITGCTGSHWEMRWEGSRAEWAKPQPGWQLYWRECLCPQAQTGIRLQLPKNNFLFGAFWQGEVCMETVCRVGWPTWGEGCLAQQKVNQLTKRGEEPTVLLLEERAARTVSFLPQRRAGHEEQAV